MSKKTCYHCMYSEMDNITLTCNKRNLICNSKAPACALFEWDKKLLKNKLLQDLEKCRDSMLEISKDICTLYGETENDWIWQKLELEADVIGEIMDTIQNGSTLNEERCYELS